MIEQLGTKSVYNYTKWRLAGQSAWLASVLHGHRSRKHIFCHHHSWSDFDSRIACIERIAFKRLICRLLGNTYDTYATANANQWLTEVTAHRPSHTCSYKLTPSPKLQFHLLCKMKIIAEPFPCNDLFDGETWIAVG
jgi:hypothetical protein